MKLSECIEILSRRLSTRRGRVAAIANRLQHAGRLPIADAKRSPPHLGHAEFALLLIAVLAERGVESAAARAVEYADMGLDDAVAAILRAQVQPGDLIVREGGATATIGGHHNIFGKPAEDGAARFATGPTLSAIAAEFQGVAPHHADAIAALSRI